MKRIRGKTLQRIRDIHFRRHPMCVECEKHGRHRLATQLDHIVPLHLKGIESPDPFRNRQGLCDACHLEKSKRERGHEYRPKVTIGVDGWPTTGRGIEKSYGSKR